MESIVTERSVNAATAWVAACALLFLAAARTVSAAQNVTITSSATATATVGQQITDTVTLSGGGPPPTGNLIIAVFPNNPTCTGTPSFQCTAMVTGNGSYNCGSTPAGTAGPYTWGNFYSGDANYNPQQNCGGTGETTVVTAPQSAGSLTFTSPSYTVSEAGGSAKITVQRTGGSSGAVSVHFATSDGTAMAGQNYAAASGDLSWSNGDAIDKFFEVFVNLDGLVNGDKTVNLTLSSPTGGATIGNPASAVLTITEGDVPGPGKIQLGASEFSVSAGAGIQFPIYLLDGSNGDGSFHYATADGTAQANRDYLPTSGTALWSKHSEDTAPLVIDVLTVPTILDGQGTLDFSLSDPVGGPVLGNPSTAHLTIVPPATATLDGVGGLSLVAPVTLLDTSQPALIAEDNSFVAQVYVDLRNRLVLQCGGSSGDPIYDLDFGRFSIPGDAKISKKGEVIVTSWTFGSGTASSGVKLQSFPGCTGTPSQVTKIPGERDPRISFFDIFFEPLGEKEQGALITVADLAAGGSVLRWRSLDDHGVPVGNPTGLISFAGKASAPRLRSALAGLLKLDIDVTPPAPGQPFVYTGVIDPSGGHPKVIRQGEWTQYLLPYINGGRIATLPNGSTFHLWDECTANPAAGGKCRVNAQWEDRYGQAVGSPVIDLFGSAAGNFSVERPTVTAAGPDRVIVAAEEHGSLRDAILAVNATPLVSSQPVVISQANGDFLSPAVFPRSSGDGFKLESFFLQRGGSASSTKVPKAAATSGVYRQRLIAPQPCTPTGTTLCLNGGRFRVDVTDVAGDGTIRSGQGVKLTDDTGYFWFFSPGNVEMLVKVLDACASFNRFWVFAAGLTNVQVSATVTDANTGAMVALFNPQGRVFQPYQNAAAFACNSATATASAPGETGQSLLEWMANSRWSAGAAVTSGSATHELGSEAPAGRASASASSCSADATHLCLSGGRYQVSAAWQTPDGGSGAGQAVAITPDTGYFWFFSSSNVEMLLKVLNGCGLNQRYWVFAAGLTNVQVTTTVKDTQTQVTKIYVNHQGAPFVPVQDTSAFATCP